MPIDKYFDTASLGLTFAVFVDALPHIAAGLAVIWWGIRIFREWRAARRGDPL